MPGVGFEGGRAEPLRHGKRFTVNGLLGYDRKNGDPERKRAGSRQRATSDYVTKPQHRRPAYSQCDHRERKPDRSCNHRLYLAVSVRMLVIGRSGPVPDAEKNCKVGCKI